MASRLIRRAIPMMSTVTLIMSTVTLNTCTGTLMM